MTSVPEPRPGTPPPIDRGRAARLLVVVGLLGGLTLWRSCRDRPGVHDLAGTTMGTSFSVRIDAELSEDEVRQTERVVRQALDRVNRLMSTFDTSSALVHLNRHGGTEPVHVPAELAEVLAIAGEVSARSGGAFDVTVAPLVDAWGFGSVEPADLPPSDALLRELGEGVGWRKLVVDTVAGTVARSDPRVIVDLSGIAKGYGVAHVAAALRRRGLSSFLVEVGGDLEVVGARRDGTPWRVGIERPDAADRGLFGAIEIVDAAVATSGDYRNFFEQGGVRYAHIIDPRTSRPIRARDVAVSVIHDDAARADAWATALTVLGPEAGFEVAEREEIAALFLRRTEDGYDARMTAEFTARAPTIHRLPPR